MSEPTGGGQEAGPTAGGQQGDVEGAVEQIMDGKVQPGQPRGFTWLLFLGVSGHVAGCVFLPSLLHT